MKFQNCIQCAVGSAVLVTSFVGFPFVKYCCEHTNTGQCKIIIRPCKARFCASLSIMIFLIVACSLCAMNIKNSFQTETPYLHVTIYTFDMMSLVCSISAMAVTMLNVNRVIDMINTYQRALDKWQELTSQILLSEVDTMKVRKQIYYNLLLIGVLMIGFATGLYYCTEPDSNWSVIEKVGAMISFYVNLLLVFIVDAPTHLYFRTYSSYRNHLENELYEIFFINKNVRNILVDYAQLHIQLKKIVTIYNDFINPTTIIWIVACIINLIATIWVSLWCLFENKTNTITPRILLMQAEFVIYVFVARYLGYIGTYLENLGMNGLKFFNKFPISQLDYEEAAKFEVLRSFFIKVNPCWTVSNMFPVGIRLVGAMIGTVLSYVSVVIQFYIAWVKSKN